MNIDMNKFIASIDSHMLEIVNVGAQVILALIALFALIYAIREYRLTRRRYLEENRPYVQVELERATAGLMNIVIQNTGKSAAKNIHIEFSPNIALYEHSKTKINSFKFLKNMKFLSTDKSFTFYFGSVMGGKTKICREFNVKVEYEDVEGNKFKSDALLDPRDFLGLMSLGRKDIHDVAKYLEDIKKELKTSNDTSKKLNSQIEKGLTIRDTVYNSLSLDELIVLIKQLLTVGVDGVYNTFPMEKDAKIIAKITRDRLLSNSKLTDRNRKVLKALNRFETSDYDFQTQEVVDELLEAIDG